MRHLCIHCHFYQPPRENPWIEAIERQDSAAPFHDWNERINAECYAPNAAARILAGDWVQRIVSNYSAISFNFGPTLLSWLEEQDPVTYAAILAADRESQKRFSGHGAAIAQAYNHMILPLASARDKRTQVIWGMADFRFRFDREPESLWLPETAVDVESLEVLADAGMRYAILAPRQAARIRKIGSTEWVDVSGGRIDPTRAYRAPLPSGRSIDLFFYDGPVSQGVAFEKLLDNGEKFANRLLGAFSPARSWPELVHIATDGETYGHHHRFGEMALAYALHHIEASGRAHVTNYGEYLELHPAELEVEIVPNSSWSCAHGVERWRSNCGCKSTGNPWSQEWRGPLRAAFDWLRDTIAPLYEQGMADLVRDAWSARDGYINVVLDRSDESRARFLTRHAKRDLNSGELTRLWRMLEMQRHAMLMYTSCGWFFDEVSGLETVQVIMYAGRAVQLAQELSGGTIERQFLRRLRSVRSNLKEQGDGAAIYKNRVKTAIVEPRTIAAHYAFRCLIGNQAGPSKLFGYEVRLSGHRSFALGSLRLIAGKAQFTSIATRECREFTYCAMHPGDHNLHAGVRLSKEVEALEKLLERLERAIASADLPQLIRIIDKTFGNSTFALQSLFSDEQRRIVDHLTAVPVRYAEADILELFANHAPLLRYLSGHGLPVPKILRNTVELGLNILIRQLCESETPNLSEARDLLSQAKAADTAIDVKSIYPALVASLDRAARRLSLNPTDPDELRQLDAVLQLHQELPFQVDLGNTQRRCFVIGQEWLSRQRMAAAHGDPAAALWVERFVAVAEKLKLHLEE